jgi:hypothetical protein
VRAVRGRAFARACAACLCPAGGPAWLT